jgi:hypothetical protein
LYFKTAIFYYDLNQFKTFQLFVECHKYMNMNVHCALSWPMVCQDYLEVPENAAWAIQTQRAS